MTDNNGRGLNPVMSCGEGGVVATGNGETCSSVNGFGINIISEGVGGMSLSGGS